jgi:hypothetical protein
MSAGIKCVGVQLGGFLFESDPVVDIPAAEIVSIMEFLKGRPLSDMRLFKVRLSASPEWIRCDRDVINRFLRGMSAIASRAPQYPCLFLENIGGSV